MSIKSTNNYHKEYKTPSKYNWIISSYTYVHLINNIKFDPTKLSKLSTRSARDKNYS